LLKIAGQNDALRADFNTFEPDLGRYSKAPLLAIWEVSRACDLACIHCRASAKPEPDPEELTFEEGRTLLKQIRAMGTRLVVFTGGDPLKRPDIFGLIKSAKQMGIVPSLSPSVTPLLGSSALRKAKDAGCSSVSVSIDGASGETHDEFRGVPGAFGQTLQRMAEIRDLGIELRVNTTVTSTNLHEIDDIAQLAARSGAKVWSVFFLVPTGRASTSLQISPTECEKLLNHLYKLSSTMPFRIKTTEAPHYRRVVMEALSRDENRPPGIAMAANRSGGGRFAPGLNDGNGFAFISHTGEVYPSGFLPLSAGNVRRHDLADIYRHSPLFRALRDPEKLKGRCGACEYRTLCGGSRSRAYAESGDPLGEDNLCAYEPVGLAKGARAAAIADGDTTSSVQLQFDELGDRVQ
jgi:radical SAM protein